MDHITSLPHGPREGAIVMSTNDKGTVPDNFVNIAMYATDAVACPKQPKPVEEEPPSKCCSKPSKARRDIIMTRFSLLAYVVPLTFSTISFEAL